jgi:hypothetical protein
MQKYQSFQDRDRELAAKGYIHLKVYRLRGPKRYP